MSRINFSDLDRQADALESASTEDTLRWAWSELGPSVAMGTAFGATGMALLDIVGRTVPEMPVFTIDTGYLFEETLELKARVEDRYGITIDSVSPLGVGGGPGRFEPQGFSPSRRRGFPPRGGGLSQRRLGGHPPGSLSQAGTGKSL